MQTDTIEVHDAIKQFQCVGCVSGPDPATCPAFKPSAFHDGCESHCAGTTVMPGGRINLGLPKGFDKVGALPEGQHTNVRLYLISASVPWNYLNIPVWYQFDGTWTYVRTACPRIGQQYADVFLGDRTADVLAANPSAFNVDEFIGEID